MAQATQPEKPSRTRDFYQNPLNEEQQFPSEEKSPSPEQVTSEEQEWLLHTDQEYGIQKSAIDVEFDDFNYEQKTTGETFSSEENTPLETQTNDDGDRERNVDISISIEDLDGQFKRLQKEFGLTDLETEIYKTAIHTFVDSKINELDIEMDESMQNGLANVLASTLIQEYDQIQE